MYPHETMAVLYGLFISFTVFVHRGHAEDSNLPNSTCTIFQEGTLFQTRCDAYCYRLPSNFNVTRLDPAVTRLQLVGRGSVVEENYVPFPARENLTSVFLVFFNEQPEEPRFPLAGLLINNRGRIKQLIITAVKLLYLTVEDFRGFGQLEELGMGDVHLMSISVSVFNAIGAFPTPAVPITYSSKLKFLTISYNPLLVDLDWSFLLPVSQGLQRISAIQNSITTSGLTCSTPFTLNNTDTIELWSNRLRTVPRCVFDTLTSPTAIIILDSQQPEFCENSTDCNCCDLYDFAQWIDGKNGMTTAYLNCGRNATRSLLNSWNLAQKPDWYIQCGRPVPRTTSHPLFTSNTSGMASVATTTNTTPAALPGCIQDDSSIFRIQCLKTKLTFPSSNFNDTDALTAVLTVDNTMKCRTVMHDAHEWIEARIGLQRGWTTRALAAGTTRGPLNTTRSSQLTTSRTTPSGRGKRDIQFDLKLPTIMVACQSGNLTASEDEPEMSEATKLTFTTTGSLSCRKLFVEFLVYISRMQ